MLQWLKIHFFGEFNLTFKDLGKEMTAEYIGPCDGIFERFTSSFVNVDYSPF